jgi:diadenosine tetraphosphate (Ap4A) HIT family hydrolase
MGVLTIWDSGQFSVSQAGNVFLPGYLLVESRPGKRELKDLNPQEDRSLLAALDLARTLLRKRIRPQRIIVVKDRDARDRLRYHVIPGTAEVLDGGSGPQDGAEIAKSVCSRFSDGATIYGAIELLDFVSEARDLCSELQAEPSSAG